MKNSIGVAFFAYTRVDGLAEVIESLKRNNFDKIYFFQDGLKEERDRIKWDKVNKILSSVNFVENELHVAETNLGLANSITAGINYVFQFHERVIALEDDILLADQYNEFMQLAFDKYEDNKEVMCIAGGDAGHIVPDNYEYDIFFSYRMYSTAWGTWKDRWVLYKRDLSLVTEIYKNKEKREILEKSGGDIIPIIQAQLFGQVDSWALFWVLLQIDRKGVQVLPCNQLVKDIGRMGGGTNSRELSYRYEVELYKEKIESWNLPDNIIINDNIIDYMKKKVTIPSREDRLKSYYDLLLCWVKRGISGNGEIDYFQKRYIKEIYIYGAGKITELFLNAVKNVVVKGIVVENKLHNNIQNYNIYDMSDNLIMTDICVVVMPLFDYFYIEELLRKKCKATWTISIAEVINDL